MILLSSLAAQRRLSEIQGHLLLLQVQLQQLELLTRISEQLEARD
jgi:hypothetical protein